MLVVKVLIGSCISTLFLLFVIKRFFPRWNLLDKPSDYGIKRSPIPYSAGIVFFIITLLLTTFFVQYSGRQVSSILLAFLFAGGLITFVSFLDDRYRLHAFTRLGVQFLAAVIVIWGGLQIQVISNPFSTEPFLLDQISFTLGGRVFWLLSALLVIGWLLLMMNVVNWLDGVPGLASGVSMIAFGTLLILALRQFHVVDQTLLIVLSAGLLGATFIFWLFDFYPPKVLMGDTGSMFLGFMIGVLSILAGGKMATALLVMGFPILDAMVVILRRICTRKSPFKGDYTHLHHRLIAYGFSERKTLFCIYAVCILCGAVALFLPTTLIKAVVFGVIMLGMLVVSIVINIKNVQE